MQIQSQYNSAKNPYSLIIADNGAGMDLQDVNDWAIYHKTFERRKE
jgi:HSP90 family molecular chaperone